jgi:hypothetical protein
MINKRANFSLCRKCLEESLPVDMMSRCAKLANPDYNIYERTGIREGIPIVKQTAAHRIVTDMIQEGLYIDFVETLVKIDSIGYMGKIYPMRGLDEVIQGLINEGYFFDEISGQFIENQEERISCNWGRLSDGDERRMGLLRLDIVDNSTLVKNNSKSKIDQAYNDVHNIVEKSVTSRYGRIWSQEGDGILAAFLIGRMDKMVTLAGIEIIHELFFYNRLHNPLSTPINVRLGACIGQVWYSDSEMERLKNEAVKEVTFFESLAPNNAFCVSYNLYVSIDQHILDLFNNQKTGSGRKYRLYKVGLEK